MSRPNVILRQRKLWQEADYCQNRRGVALERLMRVDLATGAWEQILVEDRSSTPADIVAIRFDFQSWLASLPQRQQQIAEVLSTGETTQAVASLFEVTSGRIRPIEVAVQSGLVRVSVRRAGLDSGKRPKRSGALSSSLGDTKVRQLTCRLQPPRQGGWRRSLFL